MTRRRSWSRLGFPGHVGLPGEPGSDHDGGRRRRAPGGPPAGSSTSCAGRAVRPTHFVARPTLVAAVDGPVTRSDAARGAPRAGRSDVCRGASTGREEARFRWCSAHRPRVTGVEQRSAGRPRRAVRWRVRAGRSSPGRRRGARTRGTPRSRSARSDRATGAPSAKASDGRPCTSCTTIDSAGTSAVLAITSRPFSPTTTHRVPSSKTIGSPCVRRIWLWTPCGFSRSTSNAPSLNTLQF